MNIKEKFLELTSRTYPHGTEKDIFPLLNPELKEDEFGNLFIKIGESDVMFTSHLDTATSALSEVVHVIDGVNIKTDGKSILGADDKAGVTIMLHMIENNIPGLYYFFLGEEVGCVGSRKVASKYKEEKIEGINKVISFDRRGTTSIITFQSGSRCCSDKFGDELSKQLNSANETFSYKNDTTGLLTDSIQFVRLYPECTNISVGYQNEHTFSEVQNIEHLEKLAEACLKVDWNNLPVERDPSKTEYSYGSYGGAWGSEYDYDYDYGYRSWTKPSVPVDRTEKTWFHDAKFNYVSSVEINTLTKKVVSVDLCKERIALEQEMIDKLLTQLELHYIKSEWDGFKLKVYYEFEHSSDCDRNDLIEYLPVLDYKEIEELKDYGDEVFSKVESKLKPTNKTIYRPVDNESMSGYCEDLYD
jgi:hypothetical protein